MRHRAHVPELTHGRGDIDNIVTPVVSDKNNEMKLHFAVQMIKDTSGDQKYREQVTIGCSAVFGSSTRQLLHLPLREIHGRSSTGF